MKFEVFEDREKGADTINIERARVQIEAQGLMGKAVEMRKALQSLLDQVEKHWNKPNNCVIGHVLCSPALSVLVSLSKGFQGNKIDLGTKLNGDKFMLKCYPHADCNWAFQYPEDCLLPLEGTISEEEMLSPTMWDLNGNHSH
ncbi:hypothetical protein EDC04DRAFT_2893983 [Pisolithus marmoratus]|nr:hypothetical protein EDC04DRAFT_2893981 [Pisolithus marmoratus]KAI6040603.1 hypothetical protein EDC04DRAFT_2893983 [Pisolithus marmoratus]